MGQTNRLLMGSLTEGRLPKTNNFKQATGGLLLAATACT
jgi:hypothetical protein